MCIYLWLEDLRMTYTDKWKNQDNHSRILMQNEGIQMIRRITLKRCQGILRGNIFDMLIPRVVFIILENNWLTKRSSVYNRTKWHILMPDNGTYICVLVCMSVVVCVCTSMLTCMCIFRIIGHKQF